VGGEAVPFGLDGRFDRGAGLQPVGHPAEHPRQPTAADLLGHGAEPRPQGQPGLGQLGDLAGQFGGFLGRDAAPG